MELNEQQFIKGFNHGYVLCEYEPKMLNILLKSIEPINSYISGMSWGQKEYELELAKSNLNEMDQHRQKSRNEKDRARE